MCTFIMCYWRYPFNVCRPITKLLSFWTYSIFSCGSDSCCLYIFYVLVFIRQRNKKIKPVGFMILLVIYASGLFYVMLDGLHEMLIPVGIYMIVILSMATLAYCRKGIVSRLGYFYVLIGAIFFLVSDSILALNKFYQPQVYASISIMLTYALAQYFIVIGMLSHKDE